MGDEAVELTQAILRDAESGAETIEAFVDEVVIMLAYQTLGLCSGLICGETIELEKETLAKVTSADTSRV